MPDDFIVKIWAKQKKGRAFLHQGRWYLNPYYPEVLRLITKCVGELVQNYDIDGIHIDDYFYPSSLPEEIDAEEFEKERQKHPKLTLIAAHFGGYTEWDESMKYLVGEDIYFDTSSTLEWLPVEKANAMIRAHGTDKFLFASDFPMWDHEGELERFNRLDLTEEEREMIFHKNAEKLLKL